MKLWVLNLFCLFLISCSTTTQREPANFQSCLQLMDSIIHYKSYPGPAKLNFGKAQSLNELEEMYGNDSLIDIQIKLTNAEINKNNEVLHKLLRQDFTVLPIAGKETRPKLRDLEVIYKAMENAEVNKNHYCYDKDGGIGFCFGRATIAHLEAVIRDVHPDIVKKIWIAGDMDFWGHHVATMIYSEKGWYVLDTNLGKIISFDKWISYYMPYKKGDKDIMVFVTQAKRFGPYDNRPYNPIDLFNTQSDEYNRAQDYFRGYFYDYFESLDNVKNKPLEKR